LRHRSGAAAGSKSGRRLASGDQKPCKRACLAHRSPARDWADTPSAADGHQGADSLRWDSASFAVTQHVAGGQSLHCHHQCRGRRRGDLPAVRIGRIASRLADTL